MAGTTVCCPNCWSWSELGKRATCKQCGTPLIFADGRVVGQAEAPAPPPAAFVSSASMMNPPVPAAGPPLAPPPLPPPPPAWPPIGVPGAPASGRAWESQATTGLERFDWVAICRWGYGAYAVVAVIGLVLLGLVVHHLSLPLHAADGSTTYTDVDLGPVFAVAAIIVALLAAVVIWLIQFPIARGILLALQVLGLLSFFSNSRALAGPPALIIAEVVGLAINMFFVFAFTMSLVYLRPRGT